MCNLQTERKFHHRAGDDTLAFELTVHVQKGPLVMLRAHLTPSGIVWSYELGSALNSGLGSVGIP